MNQKTFWRTIAVIAVFAVAALVFLRNGAEGTNLSNQQEINPSIVGSEQEVETTTPPPSMTPNPTATNIPTETPTVSPAINEAEADAIEKEFRANWGEKGAIRSVIKDALRIDGTGSNVIISEGNPEITKLVGDILLLISVGKADVLDEFVENGELDTAFYLSHNLFVEGGARKGLDIQAPMTFSASSIEALEKSSCGIIFTGTPIKPGVAGVPFTYLSSKAPRFAPKYLNGIRDEGTSLDSLSGGFVIGWEDWIEKTSSLKSRYGQDIGSALLTFVLGAEDITIPQIDGKLGVNGIVVVCGGGKDDLRVAANKLFPGYSGSTLQSFVSDAFSSIISITSKGMNAGN